jgi:glycosyltransferase involved in cell wall biosynthesis
MVHEAHVPIAADKRLPMAVWQRLQLRALLRQTDVAFAATESLGELLRRLKGVENVVHLPVGSNLPDMRSERDHRRRAMAVPSDALVIAIFGTGHAARLIGHIVEAVNFAASTQRATVLLNLGAGAPELYGVAPSVRVIAPGRQPGREVACHLAAADLFLAPLSDGVSTRRTTVMAALQHELCVIGTSGPNTDRLLLDAPDAVRLVPAANRAAFADAVREVAQDPEAQRAQAAAGKALHDEHFTWAAIGGRMLEALEARR